MDQRAAEVVKDIADRRARLGDDIQELGRKIRYSTDWRSRFLKSPWKMIGLAAAGGFLLSGIFRRAGR